MKTDTTTQSDSDALTALNRDYIQSVLHGDVRRFDEILTAAGGPDSPPTQGLENDLTGLKKRPTPLVRCRPCCGPLDD